MSRSTLTVLGLRPHQSILRDPGFKRFVLEKRKEALLQDVRQGKPAEAILDAFNQIEAALSALEGEASLDGMTPDQLRDRIRQIRDERRCHRSANGLT